MSETTPTWPEYLEAATTHLDESRAALENGATSPSSPSRPSGPIPAGFEQEATSLALGYAQLALELSTRMDVVERRLAAIRRTVVAEARVPRYVDAPL